MLLRGSAIPTKGFACVFGDACAGIETDAETGLRLGISLLGGHAIPAHGLALVLFDADALFVSNAEAALGKGVSLFSRFATPADRRFPVVFNPDPSPVTESEVTLRQHIALIGSLSEPSDGLPSVLCDAKTVCIAYAESELRLAFTARRAFCQFGRMGFSFGRIQRMKIHGCRKRPLKHSR